MYTVGEIVGHSNQDHEVKIDITMELFCYHVHVKNIHILSVCPFS